MTLEFQFNSNISQDISHKKQLGVKSGRNVSESLRSVTVVTASGEIRPYAPRMPETDSGAGRGPW